MIDKPENHPLSVQGTQTEDIKEGERMALDKTAIEESMIQTSTSSYPNPTLKEDKSAAKNTEEKNSRFSRLFGRKDKDKGNNTEKR
jgi:hypothetical protein